FLVLGESVPGSTVGRQDSTLNREGKKRAGTTIGGRPAQFDPPHAHRYWRCHTVSLFMGNPTPECIRQSAAWFRSGSTIGSPLCLSRCQCNEPLCLLDCGFDTIHHRDRNSFAYPSCQSGQWRAGQDDHIGAALVDGRIGQLGKEPFLFFLYVGDRAERAAERPDAGTATLQTVPGDALLVPRFERGRKSHDRKRTTEHAS